MRVHHLNCISTCPLGGKLMDGRSHASLRGKLSCHCLLLEMADELVLVDTGFGLKDVADPHSRLSRFFLTLLSPELREEMTAIRQIQRLGFNPRDVRHIVLTHLDFDHAGGMDDFPEARVHLLAAERASAEARITLLDRMRYRPQQWSTRRNWRVYAPTMGERWFGFDCVRELEGIPSGVALVPLVGHTYGHAGVAVKQGSHWMLLAGDAYFYHSEMNRSRPRCTPGLAAYQWLMEKDRSARLWNQRRLRELSGSGRVKVFCSHDPTEFERLAGRALGSPAMARRTLPPLTGPSHNAVA
ncbi:MAG TPA: MBL fold metallo-hydrolase [Polyangiaceae bacterium]|nr:MBL fold metallo-hydrolase [Polyangiaceae bacterium]